MGIIPTCGDGIVEIPEQCDDGNTVDTDGCDNSCLLGVGALCSTNKFSLTVC